MRRSSRTAFCGDSLRAVSTSAEADARCPPRPATHRPSPASGVVLEHRRCRRRGQRASPSPARPPASRGCRARRARRAARPGAPARAAISPRPASAEAACRVQVVAEQADQVGRSRGQHARPPRDTRAGFMWPSAGVQVADQADAQPVERRRPARAARAASRRTTRRRGSCHAAGRRARRRPRRARRPRPPPAAPGTAGPAWCLRGACRLRSSRRGVAGRTSRSAPMSSNEPPAGPKPALISSSSVVSNAGPKPCRPSPSSRPSSAARSSPSSRPTSSMPRGSGSDGSISIER